MRNSQPLNVQNVMPFDRLAAQRVLSSSRCNLVLFPATIQPRLRDADFASEAARKFQFWLYGRDYRECGAELGRALEEFRGTDPAVLETLGRDVLENVRFLAELTGDTRPFVSLRTIGSHYFDGNENSVSQCFHRDTSFLTLFRTYHGRGTEFVADAAVRREAFKETAIQPFKRETSEYLVEPFAVHQTTIDQIGILKGEIDPPRLSAGQKEFLAHFCEVGKLPSFNVGSGLIHRGPLIAPSEVRLVLTVSSFRAPAFLEASHEKSA